LTYYATFDFFANFGTQITLALENIHTNFLVKVNSRTRQTDGRTASGRTGESRYAAN